MCQSVHHLASQWLAVATVRDPPIWRVASAGLGRRQAAPIGLFCRVVGQVDVSWDGWCGGGRAPRLPSLTGSAAGPVRPGWAVVFGLPCCGGPVRTRMGARGGFGGGWAQPMCALPGEKFRGSWLA